MGVRAEFVEAPFDAIFASLKSERFDVVANQVTRTREREATYALSKPYTVSDGRHRHPDRRHLDHQPGRPQGQDHRAELDQQLGRGGQGRRRRRSRRSRASPRRSRWSSRAGSTRPSTTTWPSPSTPRPPATPASRSPPRPATPASRSFALRQDDTTLRDAINTALAELRATARWPRSREKYFGEDVSRSARPSPSRPAAGGQQAAPGSWSGTRPGRWRWPRSRPPSR